MTALAALPVTAGGWWFSRSVFLLMKVPEEALEQACGYMNILSGGTLCVFGYNAVCALLRGLGDSRRPLLFVAIAAAVNIILDLLLVGVWKLGVTGAAWATVTAQAAALLAGLFYLKRRKFFRGFGRRDFLPRLGTTVGILKTGHSVRLADGGGESGFPAGDGDVQPLRRHGGGRRRNRPQDQHIGRNALLGGRTGGHCDGRPESGGGGGGQNRRNRPDRNPVRADFPPESP